MKPAKRLVLSFLMVAAVPAFLAAVNAVFSAAPEAAMYVMLAVGAVSLFAILWRIAWNMLA